MKTKLFLLLLTLSLTTNMAAQIQKTGYYFEESSKLKKNIASAFKLGVKAEKSGNYKSAANYYQKCTNFFYPPALYAMAELLASKKLEQGNQYKTADYWYQQAAAQGHPSVLEPHCYERVLALLEESKSQAERMIRESSETWGKSKFVDPTSDFKAKVEYLEEWIECFTNYSEAYSKGAKVWRNKKLTYKDYYPTGDNDSYYKKEHKNFFKNPQRAAKDFEACERKIFDSVSELRTQKARLLAIYADYLKQQKK